MREKARLLAFSSALSVALSGAPQEALAQSVTTAGNVTSTPYGQSMIPMPDLLTEDLHVGDTGQGSMTVQDGGWAFTNEYGNVGFSGGSQGDVLVTGDGSEWEVFYLRVGNGGVGSLTIADGGLVSSALTYNIVGAESGSQGTVMVTGPASRWNTSELYVGYSGTGTVTIADGAAVVSGGDGIIGFNAGSPGAMTVTGEGSAWVAEGTHILDIYVGYSGTGTLTIDNKGSVDNRDSFIGYAAGSTGTVTVTGDRTSVENPNTATWSQSGDFRIGSSGVGTLTVESGGMIATYGDSSIGFGTGGSGTVTVTGKASDWYQQGSLTVAGSGTGTLTIADGGSVQTYGGAGIVGSAAGSTGTVTVTGQGSEWDARDQALFIGAGGQGTLTVQDGGSVLSRTATVGGSGQLGGRARGDVTVTGAGSLWQNGILDIGDGGVGSLTIADGGMVRADNVLMGLFGSDSGTLNLNGTDGSRGVLETVSVSSGQASGLVNFDGGILRATANSAVILQSGSPVLPFLVNIHAGGAFIDTNGFDVGITTGLSGEGGLIKLGSGTLTLSGDNSYQGVTQVEQGTLLWGGAAPFDNGGFIQGGQYVINGGTLDLGSNHGPEPRHPDVFALTMSSLSGNGGTVKLNSGELVVDQATDTTYAGGITGSGGLAKLGTGSLTLGGDSTYTGRTIVSEGALLVNGSIDSDVLVVGGGTLGGTGTVGGDVVNGGTLAAGNSIGTLTVGGGFTQITDGVLEVEADFEAASIDRLIVGGDAALSGRIRVDAASVLPGVELSFLSVGGTLTHLLSAESSLFDYAIAQADGRLSLTAVAAHFAEPGFALEKGQDDVARNLQEAWDAGGGSLGRLFGTLGTLADADGASYASALSDLSFGASGAAAASSIVMTQQHLDLLLSCPTFAAGSSVLTETECVWGQAGGQVLDQKASGGIAGFDNTTYSLQTGAQFEVSQNWFVGIAGGYERSSIDSDDDRVASEGDTIYAGISLTRETGPWLLSGAVAGSYGWFDNTRTIRIQSFDGQAEGDPDIANLSARVRAAYTFAQDNYYLRPLVDLDLIYAHAGGYREMGAGVLDLVVDDASQWNVYATPAMEVGTRLALSETTAMRAFAAAGVSFGTSDSWDAPVRLAGAPAAIGTFDSEVPLADVVGRLTAGIDIAGDNGLSLRVDYRGAFADTYTSHGGNLHLGHTF